MEKYFPILYALKDYSKDKFRGDLSAGITVGIMLIPQGMAYAMVAGLPPVYGLYAAIFPQIIYAILGTSRQLAVGPVAMDSLLVATGVSVLATTGTDQYLTLVILLTLMIGTIQILLGLLRFGFLVNFLSRPVINGFTYAVAFIIAINQFSHFSGLSIAQDLSLFEIVWLAIVHIQQANAVTVLLGTASVVILIVIKKYKPLLPGSLIVVTMTILAVYFFHLDKEGVKIIGVIPQGFPMHAWPIVNLKQMAQLLPIALTLAILGFIEGYSIGKTLQVKHKHEYEIKANRELIALGGGNLLGSVFGAFPTTGGFSRSLVNENAGARTQLALLISAALVLVSVLFLTPLFYYLPKTALAAIIMVAVIGLIETREMKRLWRVDRYDFFMMLITFFATVIFDIEIGIISGIVLSLLLLIYKTSNPHMAILGRIAGTNHFRNIERYKEAIQVKGVVILRFDSHLYFANANALKIKFETILRSDKELKSFILDGQTINDIDSSGMSTLEDILETCEKSGVQLKLACVIGPVRDKLFYAGFVNRLGIQNIYGSVVEALNNEHSNDVEFQANDE